ncbi:hypothetical protein QYF50_17490 [Paenibacillus vini]|uniref:hypothetical protein n=1 Tax=Paenibacillus vini TaxID=1476024 RepID=UPI0025B62DA5|nr:hypothetical protein [Paenibacillus vini]MDN4069699.1 hypothetical protein [Paenibacillus vini]
MHEACEMYPNMKRADYRRHAAHSLGTRLQVAATFAENATEYYRNKHVGGDGRFLTRTETTRLERLADYILSKDHAKGLTLRDRAKVEPEKDEVYPQIGSCARQLLDRRYNLECVGGQLTEYERGRVKVCEVCGCEFIDRSRRKNAKVCRYPCLETYGALKKRRQRNDGDTRLLRYRERQGLEYPFYSPAELFEISLRGETVTEDIGDVITVAKVRQERGKRTPTEITMDSEVGYFPNAHKKWRAEWSEEEAAALAGPVLIYNLYQQHEDEEEEFYLGHAS